jgi:SAM-dependent methyltransferase
MTENYYDQMAPFYTYLYPDWEKSIQKQADQLDSVIREFFPGQPQTILDAACGIGTQSIGLAQRGYRVTACDISTQEIEKAQKETENHGTTIEFQIADMRKVWDTLQKQFDLVIACDNAVPHLLSETEILQAFRQFYHCSKSGCLISVRDYSVMPREPFYPRVIHQTEQGRLVVFDVRKFSGDTYEMTTYMVDDRGEQNVNIRTFRGGRYYCVAIETLERLLKMAGFREVTILRERFFQPLLVAKR